MKEVYYTNEDIKELLAFYKTPLGKKVISVLPQIMRESVEVGQRYGIEAGKRALQRLEVEEYMPSPEKRLNAESSVLIDGYAFKLD